MVSALCQGFPAHVMVRELRAACRLDGVVMPLPLRHHPSKCLPPSPLPLPPPPCVFTPYTPFLYPLSAPLRTSQHGSGWTTSSWPPPLHLHPPPLPPIQRTAEDLTAWERLDDVIMGGQSASKLEVLPASEQGGHSGGAVWKGDLIVQVGPGG